MMSLKKYKMKSWLLAAAALVFISAAIGFITLTAPEAEAAGSGLKVGSTYYETWEAAVEAAGSSGTIVVTEDFTFPSSKNRYDIPAGVTLLVPYSTSSTSVNSASADHPYANETLVNSNTNSGQPYKDVSMTLTVPENVTLYVYGKLVVGGTIGSAAGTLWSGGTNGTHANLQVDGTVEMRNSAIMAVTGYVTGSGTVKATGTGAKIYEPMAVEYRGGHHTAGVADSLSAHSGEGHLCPFFQWSIQNIRTDLELHYGNSLYVYVDMYALSEHNTTNACFIGSSGAFLNLSSGTTLYASYDETKVPSSSNNALYAGRNNITLKGGSADTASLTLSVSGQTVKTSDYNFPIPYNFHITVENSTLNVKTKTQLLPGSKLEIKNGATLNVASELFVYTGANDFTSSASPNAVTLTYPNKNQKHLIYPSTAELKTMEGENGAANLIVDGKMTFTSGGKFAGVVQTNGTGEIDTTNMTEGTLKRSWGGAGKFSAACDTRYMAGETVRALKPMLYSTGSGTATTMAAGKTYHGTDAADSHTINTIQYTLYYSSSGSNKTYTEELNAEVVGSWGDTECTIIPAANGGAVGAGETVWLMNGADISALGYYTSPDLASEHLVKKYAGQTELYAMYGGTLHTVTWKDRDGSVLCTTTVMEGALPSYTGPNLDYYEDNGTPYGPTGWEPAIEPATGDITYTASYETVQIKVQDPDGRIRYIHDIGSGLKNFSNVANDGENGALGIVDGSTVTLLTSFSGRINVISDNLTLDLNGHTLKASTDPAAILLQNPGIKFTLTNSGTSGGLELPQVYRSDMHHAGVYFNSYNCELVIHNVKIDASGDERGFAVYSGKKMKFAQEEGESDTILDTGEGNKLTLDDATLIGSIGGVYMNNAFSLNIMGSTSVEAIVPVYCELEDYNTNTATLNISGGTFTSTGSGQVYYPFAKDNLSGPGLPLDNVKGSALVIDYTNGSAGYVEGSIAISGGTFIGDDAKAPIILVENNEIQDPSSSWSTPQTFITGGYYSQEIDSSFYDSDFYSCLQDDPDTGLYHVYIPTFTITWCYKDGTELKVDENVPKNTQVKYYPSADGPEEYKNLPTYVEGGTLYGFTGWSPELELATRDITYIAQYAPVNAKVESPDGTVKYILLKDSKISTYGVAADDTVTLQTDIWTRPNIDVPITFDLNGYKLTGSSGYWMAVNVAPGSGNVTITNSKDSGGIYMPTSKTAPPSISNQYAAILVCNGNLTLDHVTVSGGTISYTKDGTTYTNEYGIYTDSSGNQIPLDSFGVYCKSGSRSNLTLIDATITGHNGGVYMASQSHSLTVQGGTTITAAVPIYCNVEYYSSTGKGALQIESGTFEATNGTPAYYKNSAGDWERLTNSALVIDYASTDSADPNRELDVLIIGGTFKGYNDAAPISLIEGKPSKDSNYDYTSKTHVKPGNFVLSGYFSKAIDTSFYDSKTYVCEPDDAHGGLYRLSHPIITWKDGDGNVLHRQEVPMGEVPKYTGPADSLKKTSADGKTVQYVTSWTPVPAAVQESTQYTANFTDAKARVIAPDGSITYYPKLFAYGSNVEYVSDAVFSSISSKAVLHPGVMAGSTVQMLDHNWGVIQVTGKITLDLNGCNIWANTNPYAVYATGSAETPSEITITNSAATGGEITAKAMQDSPNGNEGVIAVKSYTTLSLEGLKITTRTGTSTGEFIKGGIGVQSGGTASSVTIKDTTITAGSVGVYISSEGGGISWPAGYFGGLTIEGENTSISAATPVYCMGTSLDITGGTFTSTGADDTHSIAYYHPQHTAKAYSNTDGNGQALPLSALVIDKSTSPKVSISGGTFKGYDTTGPISIVGIARPAGAVGEGTTGTAPTDFVTGGYYSQNISTDYYNQDAYSCVKVQDDLYQIVSGKQVSVTFNLNGHGTSFTKIVSNGGKVSKPTPEPTHSGFTFGGWYKEADCTTAWNFSSDTVTGETTIYAKWTMNSGSVYTPRESLAAGETLTLMTDNYVKNNKHLYVAFDAVSLGSGSVRIGHGETEYSSEYVDLTASSLAVKKYYNSESPVGTYDHGLNLSSGRVELQIDVGVENDATITLRCGDKEYTKTVSWDGCNGDIYVKPTGVDLTNVDAHWCCDNYDSSIWFFGDSWFSSGEARWPHYFYQDGYTDYLFAGYPGMGSVEGLASFKQALTYGKPTYAVWCMGMNNVDSNTAINATWNSDTLEFLDLCTDKGITPILTTIPSSTARNHSYKNEWIRSRNYDYVDVERAVVQDPDNQTWYTGFADNTLIHPTADGAQQIYIEIVEKLLDMGALTPSGNGIIREATAKKASNIWHGNEEYWINAGTNTFYSDANGTKVIEREDVMIHNWGEAKYEWNGYSSVKATRTCTIDDSHIETETTTNITSKVTAEATCTEEGSETYTAKFTNTAFTTQTKSKSISALGCVAHIMKDGKETYHAKTLQSAVNNVTAGEYIQMWADSTESCTISKDVYLDLNGKTVTNVTVSSGTLYGMDKSTDAFDNARGSIQITSGTVAAAAACPDESGKVYAAYTQNGTTTFNRVAFPVTRYYVEALANGKLSLGFEGMFRGNENAINALQSMGFVINNEDHTTNQKPGGDKTVLQYVMEVTKEGSYTVPSTPYTVKGLLQFGSDSDGIKKVETSKGKDEVQTVNIKEVLTDYYKNLNDNLPETAKIKAILEQFIHPREGTA